MVKPKQCTLDVLLYLNQSLGLENKHQQIILYFQNYSSLRLSHEIPTKYKAVIQHLSFPSVSAPFFNKRFG